jgi:hypothetical protein
MGIQGLPPLHRGAISACLHQLITQQTIWLTASPRINQNTVQDFYSCENHHSTAIQVL